jgi:RNA polymerase sigma factor (sigma-70 family)
MKDRGDAELVALSLGGDSRAFGALVARYQGSIHGLAYAIVAQWTEAEDLTQSAFLRAYLSLAGLRDPARFAPWLRRIATTTCMDWLEAHRPERRRAVTDIDDLDALDAGRLPEEFAMRIAEIIEAARRGDAAAVARLLSQDRALVDARGEHDKTPLHWAAETDQRELAELLIAAGADLELQTSWGATAVEWAATMGSVEVGRLLLERGARGLNLYTAAGLGLIDVVRSYVAHGRPGPEAGRRRRDDADPSELPPDSALMVGDAVSDAFYIACRSGQLAVARLLLEHGADIDARGHFGATGLHWAALNGHTEVVRWLLERGAATDARDPRFDSTPEGWALETGHADLAALIAEASRARPRVDD